MKLGHDWLQTDSMKTWKLTPFPQYLLQLFSQINVNGRLLAWIGHSKAKQRLVTVDKKYDYNNKFVGNISVQFKKLGKSKMNEFLVDQDEQMMKFYDTVKNDVDSVEHEMLYAYDV